MRILLAILCAVLFTGCATVGKDPVEMARQDQTAAEQGDVRAQYSLGVRYRNGMGVPHDDAEAVRWYRQAAEQGHTGAQNDLGVMYDTGTGVPEDDAEAVQWYRQAAGQGHAGAQCNLGLMYYNGTGVPQDYAEAARWYRQAAEQGDAGAQDILGVFYAHGMGVPEDDTEAFRWWRQAAAQGHAPAQTKIAWFLLEQGQPDEAIEAARQAVRLDPNLAASHDAACNILASLGQIEEAVASCAVALELAPENPEILNNIAWLLVTAEDPRLRDPQKGLLLAQRAVEANSGQDAASLDTLGEAYFANGRFDDAIEVQIKAIALEPQNEALQQKLHKFEQARLAGAKD